MGSAAEDPKARDHNGNQKGFLAEDGFDSDLWVGPQHTTAVWGTPLLALKVTGLCPLPVGMHPCGSVVGRAQAPARATGAKAGAAASILNHFKRKRQGISLFNFIR